MYSGSSLLPFEFSQEAGRMTPVNTVSSQDSYLLYSHVGSIRHDALFVLESCQCRPITSSLIDSDVCIPKYNFTRCCLDKFRAVIHVKNNFYYSTHGILSVWKVIWRPTPAPVLDAPLHNRNECVHTYEGWDVPVSTLFEAHGLSRNVKGEEAAVGGSGDG